MHESKLWIPFVFFLVFSVALLWWYPLQVYSAIFGLNLSQGEFVGSNGQSEIFAFTIVGAIMSLALMTYWILKQEGNKIKYAPVALTVAYIATISITMWYEQLYVNLWDAANGSSYWYHFYYSDPVRLLYVVMDMSLLIVAYPWMKRANVKFVAAVSLLTVFFFAAWYETGLGFPTSSTLAYFLNAASRISSQLTISVTVAGERGGQNRA